MLFGLIREEQEAVSQIGNLTIPELTKKVKYLRKGCDSREETDSEIANASFKKQLCQYTGEAVKNEEKCELEFNGDTLLKRCLADVFMLKVIWLCLEYKIKINVSKLYFKFKIFKEKRDLKKDIIFNLISIDVIEALRKMLVDKPREKFKNGLLYIICRNKIVSLIKNEIDEVESNNETFLESAAELPKEADWELECEEVIANILNGAEFKDFMQGTNTLVETLADVLEEKAGLSTTERKIVMYKLVYGKNHKAIMKLLGLKSEETSRTLYSRAMKKIKKFLSDRGINLNIND